VAWLRGSKVIIDWHNLGYTILGLKLGEDHFLVKIAKWCVCMLRARFSPFFDPDEAGLNNTLGNMLMPIFLSLKRCGSILSRNGI
jgi:hypothetical protein